VRAATDKDADLVVGWLQDFGTEALPHLPPLDPAAARARLALGGYLLWDDGGPVSTASVRTG
jgi:hypothetical protein